MSATFKVTSGAAAFNGDLVANAQWTNPTRTGEQTERMGEKTRNVSPVKINEFRVSAGSPSNTTDSFIELYNAGAKEVDISSWTLTEHATQQAIFSNVTIPSGTKLATHGFYLLGLSNSGLAAPAGFGDRTISVRSTAGMTAGDTISIDSGALAETRKIGFVGTAAGAATTLWQPLPDGPVIAIPIGSSSVPVTSVAGFVVGEKIALGYGATYPAVGKDQERYEVATVTAVGKPGTQALLAADAPAGAANIKVTAVANISVGDKIRLDIDSVSHGIETVTVTSVGSQSSRTALSAAATAGATNIKVRGVNGFVAGDKLTVGTPANKETVTVTGINTGAIDFTPALSDAHPAGVPVVDPGTGLGLATPLKFNHAANRPFSDRGTGISFQPATAFAHSSNEPVQPLGTGITLDTPLARVGHSIDAVVLDAQDTRCRLSRSSGTQPVVWRPGPLARSREYGAA